MIDNQTTIARIVAFMPPNSMESVTLNSRDPAETGYTNVTYANTRRMPATKDEVLMANWAMIGEEWIYFELYKTTETTFPKSGDKITDADSIVWQIKVVDVKLMKTVYKCMCLKNKA